MRLISGRLRDEWNLEYRALSCVKGKYFAEIFPEINSKPWYYTGHNFQPSQVKIINRLMCGHTYDMKYLYIIGAINSNLCEICLVPGSAEHMVFQCSKFIGLRARFEIFDKFADLKSLLKSRDLDNYKSLLNFMLEAKINL